jgi:tetratricopeptide (TPR) repeat protein
VAVFPIGRREFLAALACTGIPAKRLSGANPYPIRFRKPGPYESVLGHVEAGTDEFPFEKQAAEIEQCLVGMLSGRPLPLAIDFEGVSPFPRLYRPIGEGVSRAEFAPDAGFAEGLPQWIRSLGAVRRARFFVLPDHLVRYEIAGHRTYRVGLWKQVWQDGRLRSSHPIGEILTSAPEPMFQDITAHSFGQTPSFHDQLLKGNVFWRSRLDAATGIDIYGNNGVAVGDIDNDGWDEIYVCQQAGLPNRLYKNRGDGTLADITEKAGVGILDETTCALFVDFRNSGCPDLVVLGGAGPLLFINDGEGRFKHQPDAFRFVTQPQGVFTGMAAADYDRDGSVDLYLCTYLFFQSEDQYRYAVPYHDAQNGPPNYLFRNRLSQSGHFEDVTEESGMNHNNNRFSFAPAWCDFDGDGWPDLYVANDFGRANLYRNRNGRFRDEAAEWGVENMAPGMSAAWFDYDGNGRPDLYVSNMWSAAGQRVIDDPAFVPSHAHAAEYRSHTRGNALFHNGGEGRFTDTAGAEGAAMGRWAWSSDGIDFDNDGAPELYIAAGMLTNASDRDLESFFWRQVVAKSPATAAPAPAYENGWNALNQLVREDYSWCGREPNVFYKRVQPADGGAPRYYDFSGVSGLDFADDSRAFAVTDIDNDGNLDIILKSRLGPQVRVLRNCCGTARRSLALSLRGVESNRDAIGARIEVNGRWYQLAAGSGYLSQHSKHLHIGLGDAAEASVTILWPSGKRQAHAKLRAGFRYQIEEGSGEIKAVPFAARAPIAAAAIDPVNAAAFGATWLWEPVPLPEKRDGPGFLLLTATGAAAPPGVRCEIVDLSRAAPELAAQYAVFRRYLFELRTEMTLPLLLLIDGQSRARKIYQEIPPAGELQADFRTLMNGPSPELALPFAGRYYIQPRRNYFKLGAAFYWAGYPDRAIPYLGEAVRQDSGNWKALFALAQIHGEAERWQPALENYQHVLAIRPAHSAALAGAAEAYAHLNDPRQAESFFRRSLESDPNNADAANQLGLLLARQDRTAEAKQWFERAIAADPAHIGAINNLAVLFTKLGQTNDAIAAFRYGIAQAPEDVSLYLNLGRLYVSIGERQKAGEIMRQLLDRKPGDPVAMRALRELDSR